jgi:hypothetical protein
VQSALHTFNHLLEVGEVARPCDPGPEALLFEAAALLRWSSLPFRDVEPCWREAVARRV